MFGTTAGTPTSLVYSFVVDGAQTNLDVSIYNEEQWERYVPKRGMKNK